MIEKLQKFISVKFVGFLVALAALVLVSIYGELGAALVSGVCGLYAALVAGNATSKHIRSQVGRDKEKAKLALILKTRQPEERPDG